MQIANGAAEGSGLGLQPAMPLDVTNETPAAARVQLYQTQSCVFITTRILVVDFLVHRLQPSQVRPLNLLFRQGRAAHFERYSTPLPCENICPRYAAISQVFMLRHDDRGVPLSTISALVHKPENWAQRDWKPSRSQSCIENACDPPMMSVAPQTKGALLQ